MANAIAMTGGAGLISRDDLAKSLNNAAMSMPAVGNGGLQYLKMDKGNGDWLFGQEETVVEEDSLWAVNPLSLQHGYVAWDTDSGGAPIQEVMVPISRPLPALGSLPEAKGAKGQVLNYAQQRSVTLVCISGEDEGTAVEYKQGSVGAMKLFASLTNDLLTQVDKGNDIVAIVKLASDSYKHKKYGRIFNPVWPVQEWRPIDDTTAPAAAGDDGQSADQTDDAADEEAKLAAEYAAEQAKSKPKEEPASEDAPRRRLRR